MQLPTQTRQSVVKIPTIQPSFSQSIHTSGGSVAVNNAVGTPAPIQSLLPNPQAKNAETKISYNDIPITCIVTKSGFKYLLYSIIALIVIVIFGIGFYLLLKHFG